MENGLTSPTEIGVPQGGPLSPILSNIYLDKFDKELEERGLRFVVICRYLHVKGDEVNRDETGVTSAVAGKKTVSVRSATKTKVVRPNDSNFLRILHF